MQKYDGALDHLNYLRWGTLYIADVKKMLPTTAPEVEAAFTESLQAVLIAL